MRTLPLIPSHNLLDMILHHTHHFVSVYDVSIYLTSTPTWESLTRRVIINRIHPLRQLTIPDQRMAPHLLFILRRKIRNRVGVGPAELPAVGLRGIPLHGVFGRDGTELCAFNKVLLRVVRADGQRGADVGAAPGEHGGVEGCGCLADGEGEGG